MSFKIKTTKTLFMHVDFVLEFMDNDKLEIEKDYLIMIRNISLDIFKKTGQMIVPNITLGYRIEDYRKIEKHFNENNSDCFINENDYLENILTISASSIDNDSSNIEEWKLAIREFCERIYSSFKEECDTFAIRLKQNGFSINFRYMDTYFNEWITEDSINEK